MKLWELKPNKEAFVSSFSTLDPETASLFRDIGIKKSACIRCVLKGFLGSPCVYEINDSLYSLCKESADKIFVKEGAFGF